VKYSSRFSVGIALTQAFSRAGHPAMHEVQSPGTGVAVVTRLEAIGSDSDLVATAT
jgi:hypothetical protein